jgi:tRNA-dihydrouridine synthase
VHGRTAAQGWNEPADWDAVAEVKAAARVPVIGNGDMKGVGDVARMKAHTGCDAVMIGRAAMGNPWIFAGRDLAEVPLAERVAVMRRHLRLLVEHHEPRRGVLHFRKHLGRYLRGVPGCGHMRRELVELRSPEALHQALAELATLPPARCG